MLSPAQTAPSSFAQVGLPFGRSVLLHFDTRQRQQILDQARHARRLFFHDRQKALLGLAVVGGRSAQGLDKADQAGQRRAQFVAGVGDKVRAHPLGAVDRGQIVQCQDGDGAVERRGRQRYQAGRELAVDLATQRDLDDPSLLAGDRRLGGLEQNRIA